MLQAEKRAEALKRGKEDFYTTDAKFDERFKLAYGLNDAKVRAGLQQGRAWVIVASICVAAAALLFSG